MFLRICLCLFFVLPPLVAHSAIYGYVDDNGIYHFTNIAPIGKKYHVVVHDSKSSRSLGGISNDRYDDLILEHSQNHGVDPSLTKAVMKAESNFNPQAVSRKGALGLMQLMPDTARLMKVGNPLDPNQNIQGGTRYLRFLDETFQGNLDLILAAYNAGPRRVIENNMSVPSIDETKNFIRRVRYYYNLLKQPNEG
jgi:soluble lytic murein transglycosylase-like protein